MIVDRDDEVIRYRITGSAAHLRIRPFLPDSWVDCSNDTMFPEDLHFLWENAPRRETALVRDTVRCYSHLPNGTNILDSKWVLARLFDSNRKNHAVLKSHCFRGVDGFRAFCDQVGLLEKEHDEFKMPSHLPDLSVDMSHEYIESIAHAKKPHWWVIKDSQSNGAGGIWVVGPRNAARFLAPSHSQLLPGHSYVAQEYVWPPVLYHGRKCHVRVYAVIDHKGSAFCHRRAFLHVANHSFGAENEKGVFADSVHITNCCANSDDKSLFAGEICADLLSENDDLSDPNAPIVALAPYFDSIKASIDHLTASTGIFLRGGQRNHGFEYLGLDFILSSNCKAYLLEVNAPPSQDTATGLPHAEALHNDVLRDLVTMLVLPSVTGAIPCRGGWQCVRRGVEMQEAEATSIVPSKAALLNKMKWALYEKKCMAFARQTADTVTKKSDQKDNLLSSTIRSHFTYYDNQEVPIFWENAGGTQVPKLVVQEMLTSLENRDRSVQGYLSAQRARKTLSVLLGAAEQSHDIYLGSNASQLLSQLAGMYGKSRFLGPNDEIVLSSENHQANVKPWVEMATHLGLTIRWWRPTTLKEDDRLHMLEQLISEKTCVLAFPHVSNVLGQTEDVTKVCEIAKRLSGGRCHTVVDGVAAVPHVPAKLNNSSVDWYIISCHKLFGPHLGAMCGHRQSSLLLHSSPKSVLETGTVSYEACQGVVGLGKYFCTLSDLHESATITSHDSSVSALSMTSVMKAYQLIRCIERELTEELETSLMRYNKVVLHRAAYKITTINLPIVCFSHESISSSSIVEHCRESQIVCRHGKFLATDKLFDDLGVDTCDGVVRFSLVHYASIHEVHRVLRVLESMDGWF